MVNQIVVVEDGTLLNAAWQSWPDLLGIGTAVRYSREDDKTLASDKAAAFSEYVRGDLSKLGAFLEDNAHESA
jgi:hypothetical protein